MKKATMKAHNEKLPVCLQRRNLYDIPVWYSMEFQPQICFLYTPNHNDTLKVA